MTTQPEQQATGPEGQPLSRRDVARERLRAVEWGPQTAAPPAVIDALGDVLDGDWHEPMCFQRRPEGPHPLYPQACDCRTIRNLRAAGISL